MWRALPLRRETSSALIYLSMHCFFNDEFFVYFMSNFLPVGETPEETLLREREQEELVRQEVELSNLKSQKIRESERYGILQSKVSKIRESERYIDLALFWDISILYEKWFLRLKRPPPQDQTPPWDQTSL